MIVPVRNIVEQVDLTSDDVLLPLLECVVNSVISLQQSEKPSEEKKIQIQIERGDYPQNLNFEKIKTISSFKVIDNGVGFTSKNYRSFETPFSQINKDFGCKGIGRFTVLAAFDEYYVKSSYIENGQWFLREFRFTSENEIEPIALAEFEAGDFKTIVEIKNCNSPNILERSALSIKQVAEAIMQHCLIYYLSGTLPRIEIIDEESKTAEVVNELFEKVSKEKERTFQINNNIFKL